MKASVMGEVVLLCGILALAYLLYIQQGQLDDLSVELDRVRGTIPPPKPPARRKAAGND